MEGFTEKLAGRLGAGLSPLFLALTFVVVIIVVLLCRDAATAIVIIGLLLALAGCALGTDGRGPDSCADGACSRRGAPAQEGYWPLPGAPAPRAVAAGGPPAGAGRYPGAIDLDEYDSEGARGYRDRTEDDDTDTPEGNPFVTNRVWGPAAAAACVDDEANDDEIDGDERMVYGGLHRNDATRVAAGTMNRRRDLDKYLREEVTEAENREWWGQHEE